LDIVQKIWPLSENFLPLLVSQAGYGPAYATQHNKTKQHTSNIRAAYFFHLAGKYLGDGGARCHKNYKL